MPSLFLSLSPPRFAFQTGSPPQPPSRVCGPLYTVGASIPSLPARQFHLQRCCGSHPGALSSSPQASTNLLSKRTGSASSCLPELGLGRCWTLPEGAAPTHWTMVWQSLQTRGKEKKPNPNTFTDRPWELSAGTAEEGHSNVMCIFRGQLFLSLTWIPFPPIIRLLNSQSRAPNLLAVKHVRPSPDTNHWLIRSARET